VDRLSASTSDITGYVIAGGHSRRFGQDKRFVEIDGVSLLDRTRRLLRSCTGAEPYLVGDNLDGAAPDPSRVLGDSAPQRGPLGGITAALSHAKTQWCLIFAVDLPRLESSDVLKLIDETSNDFDVVTLSRAGEAQPLAAMYNRRTTDFWRRRLAVGRLSLSTGIYRLAWKTVLAPGGPTALDNLNTPRDLHRLHAD
jgi:molybdopterin-guanine dinucleotide biosynthesis protein A